MKQYRIRYPAVLPPPMTMDSRHYRPHHRHKQQFLLCIVMAIIIISIIPIIAYAADDHNNHHHHHHHHQHHHYHRIHSIDIERILDVPNLDEAIRMLTEVWNKVHHHPHSHNKTRILISRSPVNDSDPNGRSRRSTNHTASREDDVMPSDDGTAYRHHPIVPADKRTNQLTFNCSSCMLHDEQARSLRIENIKMNILNKLNMERAPNVSLKMLPKIPPLNHILARLTSEENFLMDDAGNIGASGRQHRKFGSSFVDHHHHFGPLQNTVNGGDDEEEFFLSAEKSIVFAQTSSANRVRDAGLHVQYFKFPVNVQNSPLQKAHLWLYVKGSSHRKLDSWISIYQVVNGATPLVSVRTKRISNSTARRGGWVHIRMEKVVQKWFQNPEQNLGIVIHAYDGNGQQVSVIHSDDVSPDSPLRPYMEIRIDPKTSGARRKRTVGLNCEDKSAEVRCCRYPLTVDFEQFGWDWIIAPKKYQANYCSGECQPFIQLNQYPHTHLIQQMERTVSMGPCCSPRKMSSISMLYMDSDFNVIYGIVPNMVVDRCGCS